MYGIRRTQKLAYSLKDIWVVFDYLVLACYHLVGPYAASFLVLAGNLAHWMAC